MATAPFRRPSSTVFALAIAPLALACAVRPEPGWPLAEPGCRTAISYDRGDGRAGIDWVVAAEAGELAALDEWCAAVGPAVVARHVPRPAFPVDSLLIITWNSHIGGGDVARFVTDLRDGAHTGGAPVRDFVLLLQEAHRRGDLPAVPPAGARHARRVAPAPDSGDRIDVVTASRLLGLDLVYVPGVRTGGADSGVPEDRGTAILSTLPLHDARAIELPHERHRRVVAMAVVRARGSRTGEWMLHVASVHLDNRSPLSRPLATFGGGRLRQAMALEEAVPDTTSVVLGGDMNSWSLEALEEAPRYLHRHFPDATAEGDATFRAGWLVQRRLDYLFFRLTSGSASPPATIPERYGSDHHPVMSWVRFQPAGAGGKSGEGDELPDRTEPSR